MTVSRHAWKRHASLAISALLLLVALARTAAAAIPDGATYVPGEVILKFRPDADPADRRAILSGLGATATRTLNSIGADRVTIGRIAVADAVERYSGDPAIEYIEPNYIYQALVTPNDPDFGQLWALRNAGQTGGTPGADIGAVSAWESTTGSSSVLVAIIDTGIDYTHPDLVANVFTNPGEIPGNGIDDDGNGYVDDVHGYDFANLDGDPMDDNNHGTHVAGTIGAVGNNGIGVVGVNWNVKLLAVKFLSGAGSGTTANAVLAVQYATLMGARVMNNSWGGSGYSEALRQAIAAANDAGVVFVAAAGNASLNTDVYPEYPASYDVPNVVSVAATDHDDKIAAFSNYGVNTVDLAAPGVNIVSTLPGNTYGAFSGTSMSTPHVSGVFALMIGRYPAIGPVDAKSLLMNSVDRKPSLEGKVLTGGRLNGFLPIADPDSLPPDPVTDLAAVGGDATRITLRWTATGDDGQTGHPSRYDLRYSTTPITEANFAAATHVDGPLDPLPAGRAEQIEIRGLTFSTLYSFALRAYDEWGNPSPISNVARVTTLGPPDIGISPSSLSADLLTGRRVTRLVTITNAGPGELVYGVSTRPGLIAAAARSRIDRASRPASEAIAATPGDRPYDRGRTPARERIDPIAPAPDVDRGRAPAHERVDPLVAAPAGAGDPKGGVRDVALELQSPLATTSLAAAGMRIAILQSGANASEIKPLLLRYADIERLDVIDARLRVPALERLAEYDGVLVIGQLPFSDPVGVGNVLADYADLGRGVIVTVPTFIGGYAIQGRFLTEGYSPLEVGSGPIGYSALGAFNASHPIMKGVISATGDLRGQVVIAPEADLVASWDDGNPCVITRHNNVAAVNVFVGATGYWTGDVPLLLHNAIAWASQTARWLSTDVRGGVLPAGGRVDLAVTLDATGLAGGSYEGQLVFDSDDPDESHVVVVARLTVTGAPDMSLEGERVTVESVVNYFVESARTTHTLPVTIPPTGAGSLELVAEGDYAEIGESATATVEGTVIGAVGESGNDCAVHSASFALSATDFARLTADGRVDIEVRNSDQVGVFCLANRHTVRLRYPLAADRIDFGSAFVGKPHERAILVRNIGSVPLALTGVASDNPAFVPLVTVARVDPGAVVALTVRFTAPRSGPFEGRLRFTSNDPDQPSAEIALRGIGLHPPVIAVSPPAFDEILAAGARVTRTFTIENRGPSELDWRLELVGGLATGARLAGDVAEAATGAVVRTEIGMGELAPGAAAESERGAADRAVPDPIALREARPPAPDETRSDRAPEGYRAVVAPPLRMANAAALLVQDIAPWGTTSNEEILINSGLAFDRLPSAALATTDLAAYRLVIVAGDQPTPFYQTIASSSEQIDRYVVSGGVLEFHAAASGWSNGEVSVVTLPGGMHLQIQRSDFNQVLDTRHRMMSGVLNLFTGSPASLAHFTDIPAGAKRLTSDASNAPDLVEYRHGLGTVISGCQPFEYAHRNNQHAGIILRNMIRYASELRPGWFTAGLTTARVPAGGRAEIAVTFDAGPIAATRTLEMVIHSNDPDRPEIVVPVSLRVGAFPAIVGQLRASPRTLDVASHGKWIECRLSLPPPHRTDRVVLSSVLLNGIVHAEHGGHATEATNGDVDADGPETEDLDPADGPENANRSDLKLKFRRAPLIATLPEADSLDLVVTGLLDSGAPFVARDRIRIVRPRLLRPNGGEVLVAGRTEAVTWNVPRTWHDPRSDLLLSTDGGNVWTPVVSGLHGESYTWRVPATAALEARLRVVVHESSAILGHDSSDRPFRINLATAEAEESPTPRSLELMQNSPNPFATSTRIVFELPRESAVRTSVYDMTGRLVAILVDQSLSPGRHEVRWDGHDRGGRRVAPGVYLYRLETPERSITRRMALIE